MSIISASTLTTTALQLTADTAGTLVFRTGATPTTALTLGADQSATFTGAVNFSTAGFTNLSVTGVATFAAGTVSLPSITTAGDTNTGIYFPAADTIAFTEGGVEALRLNSNGQTATSIAGTASLPSFTRTGDENTGIFFPAADTIAFSEGGTEVMRIDSSGNVSVASALAGGRTLSVYNSDTGAGSYSQMYIQTNAGYFIQSIGSTANGALSSVYSTGSGGMYQYTVGAYPLYFGTNSTERMRISSSGDVSIGASSSSGKLLVYQGNSADCTVNLQVGNNGYAVNLQLVGNDSNGARFNNIASRYGSTENWYVGGGSVDKTLVFKTDATERMRITSGGDLLVGQTTAAVETGSIVTAKNLEITRTVDSDGAALGQLSWVNNTNAGAGSGTSFVKDVACIKGIMDGTGNNSGGYITFETKADAGSRAEQARITAAGLLQFNSGYGSVATAYGCRAWVNFNGTGTVAIRSSGNVSSITDNGTGDYTINFTTAMPDANYSIAGLGQRPNTNQVITSIFGSSSYNSLTTTTARVATRDEAGNSVDSIAVCVAIFR